MWRFYFTLRNWTLQIKDRVKGQLSFPKTVSHVHAKHGLDVGKCSGDSGKWHSSMWFMVSDGSFEKLKHFDLWSFKFIVISFQLCPLIWSWVRVASSPRTVFQATFSPAVFSSSCWVIPTFNQTRWNTQYNPSSDFWVYPWGHFLARCAWKNSKGKHPGGILIRCLNHL